MNEREIAEIRRRFHPTKSNITRIRGCYVNEQKEIVTEFDQSLALLSQEESEKMLTILKRTLSGTLDKNLIDISFTTQQVVDSEEHKLLMALRNSSLHDDDATKAFYQRVIQALNMEGNYLIVLAHDKYDIPYRSKDGDHLPDASADVFSYILCSICPIKPTKPALGYYVHDNIFRSSKTDWLVSAPELGFMFPTFDDRSTNLYNALYYSRDSAESHEEFADAVFRSEVPMSADVQKETFQAILMDTLKDDCNLEVVQAVHGELCEMILAHKESKEPEPLAVSKDTVKRVLHSCGIGESHLTAFESQYDEEFGADTELSPRNIVDPKQISLCTPDVKIQVNPERSDLVETRTINGKKYILIRVEENVELNGVSIHID